MTISVSENKTDGTPFILGFAKVICDGMPHCTLRQIHILEHSIQRLVEGLLQQSRHLILGAKISLTLDVISSRLWHLPGNALLIRTVAVARSVSHLLSHHILLNRTG
jgi:hypothetical protein